jgi:hypothetical protein
MPFYVRLCSAVFFLGGIAGYADVVYTYTGTDFTQTSWLWRPSNFRVHYADI